MDFTDDELELLLLTIGTHTTLMQPKQFIERKPFMDLESKIRAELIVRDVARRLSDVK